MSICQSCQQKSAIHHTCTVVDGVTQTRDLCAECFASTAPQDVREFSAMVTQTTCFFCGGMSNVGGTEPLARALGVHRLRFLCFGCSRAYSSEVSRVLRTIPKDLPAEHRPTLLATLSDEVERRVRERIAQTA